MPEANASVDQELLRVTNVTSSWFTVVWLTEEPEVGLVEWGFAPDAISQQAFDDRGAASVAHTHHVTVSGLPAQATLYYDVISGGVRDDNQGAHYQITLAEAQGTPSTDSTFGRVRDGPDGANAVGCLVFLKVQDADGNGSSDSSQTYSGLVDENGYWHLNIGTIRTVELDSYFSYDPNGGDLLALEAACHPSLSTTLTTRTDVDAPAPLLVVTSLVTRGIEITSVEAGQIVTITITPSVSDLPFYAVQESLGDLILSSHTADSLDSGVFVQLGSGGFTYDLQVPADATPGQQFVISGVWWTDPADKRSVTPEQTVLTVPAAAQPPVGPETPTSTPTPTPAPTPAPATPSGEVVVTEQQSVELADALNKALGIDPSTDTAVEVDAGTTELVSVEGAVIETTIEVIGLTAEAEFVGVIDLRLGNITIETVNGEGTGEIMLAEGLKVVGDVTLVAEDGALAIVFEDTRLIVAPEVPDVEQMVGGSAEVTHIGVTFDVGLENLPDGASLEVEFAKSAEAFVKDAGVVFQIAAERIFGKGAGIVEDAVEDVAFVVQVTRVGIENADLGDNTITMEVSRAWYDARIAQGKTIVITKIADDGTVTAAEATCVLVGDVATCQVTFIGDAGGFSVFVVFAVSQVPTPPPPPPGVTVTPPPPTALPPGVTVTPPQTPTPTAVRPGVTATPTAIPTPTGTPAPSATPAIAITPTPTPVPPPISPNGPPWLIIGLGLAGVAGAALYGLLKAMSREKR